MKMIRIGVLEFLWPIVNLSSLLCLVIWAIYCAVLSRIIISTPSCTTPVSFVSVSAYVLIL